VTPQDRQAVLDRCRFQTHDELHSHRRYHASAVGAREAECRASAGTCSRAIEELHDLNSKPAGDLAWNSSCSSRDPHSRGSACSASSILFLHHAAQRQ
jgi:hypothetical protein